VEVARSDLRFFNVVLKAMRPGDSLVAPYLMTPSSKFGSKLPVWFQAPSSVSAGWFSRVVMTQIEKNKAF